jgi:hypothetical protein
MSYRIFIWDDRLLIGSFEGVSVLEEELTYN